MRLNVASIKSSNIPASVGLCADDPKLLQWLNNFQEKALNQGRYWGSIKTVQFCTVAGCLTFPREVASIEQVAVNGTGIPIYTQFWQFLNTLARVDNCSGGCSSDNCGCGPTLGGNSCGLGAMYGNCGHVQMRDRGQAVSFAVTRGNNKKIRAYPSNAGDVGKKIIFQGRDSNNIWVRTVIDGIMQDGEEVTLALPYVETTTTWGPGAPMGVIKEQTLDLVRVYSYNTDTEAEKLLASYQATETLPIYRTFNIPNFGAIPRSRCCVNEDGETIVTVTAIAKLAHIPVALDNDWLIFQNLSAYQAGIMAEMFNEQQDIAKAQYYFYGTQAAPSNGRGVMRVVNRGGAIPLLQAELRSMTGDRTDANVQIEFDNRAPAQLINFV